MNWIGVYTLFRREVLRFWNVASQTLIAPVITAGMFLAVFALALGGDREGPHGLAFVAFLAPGVVMMTVLQNSFANTSSSIIIAKVQGNIVDTLMPPLSAGEVVAAIALGGAARGIFVAVLASVALFPFAGVGLAQPIWAAAFIVVGALFMALIGLAAGIWAEKFDHVAAVTNFVVTPLSFLSGTFYSIERLPEPWAAVSQFNPIFYLIDGFRYSVVGRSDADPWVGLLVGVVAVALLWRLCWGMIASGYRLKS